MSRGYPFEQWFQSYRALGGLHDRNRFFTNKAVFEWITREAFRFGNGCRREAFDRWETFMGCTREARRYFSAIDSVTPHGQVGNLR